MIEIFLFLFVAILLSYSLSFYLLKFSSEEYVIHFDINYKIIHFIVLFSFLFLSFHKVPLEKTYLIKSFGLFFMFFSLYTLSLIDFKIKFVPTLLLLLVFIFSVMYKGIDSLLPGLILIGAFLFLKLFFENLFKIEILGEGDLPILGVFGVLFDLSNVLLLSLFVSIIVGFIMWLYFYFVKKEIFFPFVPSLFIGILFGLYFNIHKVSYLLI